MGSRFLAVCVWFTFAGAAWAAEVAVTAPVQSVGLFKNGLAVVRRTVTLPGPGVYRIDDLPTPVHGTFWVESTLSVTATASTRVVDSEAAEGPVDLQSDLAGRQVEVHLRETEQAVWGRVVEVPKPKGAKAWSRSYEQPASYSYPWSLGTSAMPQPGRFLILDKDGQREYIELSQIARLSVRDEAKTVKRRLPVLLLQVDNPAPETSKPAAEIPVTISYLTKGLSWAPSYRINLKDGKRLSIEQQAVIRNELTGLESAEVFLISGFPSMQFGHVVSPLSPDTSWAAFFQQLNQQFRPGSAMMSNVAQQVAVQSNAPGDVDMPAVPNGEGVDLYYQPVGRRTLAEGDAMSLSVASAEAEYERIVEWIVPDARDANGRYLQEYQRQQDPDKYEDAAWDSVRFKNPFKFPMTTAPAMIHQQGRFSGQRQSLWVSAAEQTTLRITKALSLRTRAAEQELAGDRAVVVVGGNDFRKVGVKGELSIQNHRNEDVRMIVRRQFSGELTRADGEAKSELREEGVYSVNRRNELTWTLALKAGESRTITYEYSVLVDN